MTGQARQEEEEEVTTIELFTLRCAQGALNKGLNRRTAPESSRLEEMWLNI